VDEQEDLAPVKELIKKIPDLRSSAPISDSKAEEKKEP
jgi:hypothetical protein